MQLVRYAVKRCKEKGLLCWLYDDDRFPSGAADGLVTRDIRYRQRFLLLTEQERGDCCPDRQTFDAAILAGQEPKGWFAASYAVSPGKARRLEQGERANSGERTRYAMTEGDAHPVTLYYEIAAEADMPCALGIEHPERCEIQWNGKAVSSRDDGWYVDESIRRVTLPGLQKGRNTLRLQLMFHAKTNLENLYLLGDFDVLAQAAGNSIALPRRSKGIGDLTRQGLPFYSGVVSYHFCFTVDQAAEYAVRVPAYEAAVFTVTCDEKPLGQIAYAPERLSLGQLDAGAHRLRIDAYIGRHNGFGYLHNADPSYRWYGPDAWRTQGDAWTDDYRLLPAGITAGILIEKGTESYG